MSRRLFGTDGVRGITGVDLTPDFIMRLAMAIGFYFPEGSRILVGMDYRAGNDAIKRIVEGVLVFSGHRVYDAGVTPTPALQYVVKTQGFDAGVMITASHNPPEYSGIKVIGSNGIEIDRDEERVVEEIYWEMRSRSVDWRSLSHEVIEYPFVNDKYIEAVVGYVDKERISRRSFKVLVDPANNTGVLTSPYILKKLGVRPLVINGTLDVEPARYPEPTPESLVQTSQATLSL
ncbi:MAG: phosphoglucosamine mutase, partial [Desulfurococcaceae archaeon]